MIRINVHEAKANLSRYLEKVEQGETVVIYRWNQPVAELRAVQQQRKTPRPWGLARESFVVPADVLAPLTAEEQASWEEGKVFPHEDPA